MNKDEAGTCAGLVFPGHVIAPPPGSFNQGGDDRPIMSMMLTPMARKATHLALGSKIGGSVKAAGGWTNQAGEQIRKAQRLERLEFSQILTRFAVGFVITLYWFMAPAHEGSSQTATMLAVAWTVGFCLLGHLALWPERHLERRTVSICADAVALIS